MFYNYYRKYKGNGLSDNFYSVLPKQLTLDKFPFSNNSLLFKDHNTCFKEVKIHRFHLTNESIYLHRA